MAIQTTETTLSGNASSEADAFFAMLGMTALFIPLVLYYFIRGGTHDIAIPPIFTLNSFTIILSSLTLEKSYTSFRQEQYLYFRVLLGVTLLLGILFLGGQIWGWQLLHQGEASLSSRPPNSIFYVISGLHALHLTGGLLLLLVIFIDALKRLSYIDTFINYINLHKQLRIELLRLYWHYLDVLWVLLFSCFLI